MTPLRSLLRKVRKSLLEPENWSAAHRGVAAGALIALARLEPRAISSSFLAATMGGSNTAGCSCDRFDPAINPNPLVIPCRNHHLTRPNAKRAYRFRGKANFFRAPNSKSFQWTSRAAAAAAAALSTGRIRVTH